MQLQGLDGKTYEFPDDTPDDAIQQFLLDQEQSQTAAQPEPAPQARSGLEQFLGDVGTGAQQMATALPRAAYGITGLLSALAGKGADALGFEGAGEAAMNYARQLQASSKDLEQSRFGPQLPEWQAATLDASMQAIPIAGGATAGIGKLAANANPMVKLMSQQVAKTAPAIGAATGSMGEVIATPLSHYAINKIDDSTLSPTSKEALKVAAPLFAGVLTGVTFENMLDHVFKNPVLTNALNKVAREALVNPDGTVKMDSVSKIISETVGEEFKPPKAGEPPPHTDADVPPPVSGETSLRSKIEQSKPVNRENLESELSKLEWYKKLSPEEQADELREQLDFVATHGPVTKYSKRSTEDLVEATDLADKIRIRSVDFKTKKGGVSKGLRMGSYVATQVGLKGKNSWRIMQWDVVNKKWDSFEGEFNSKSRAVEALQKIRQADELGGPVDHKRLVKGLAQIFDASDTAKVERAFTPAKELAPPINAPKAKTIPKSWLDNVPELAAKFEGQTQVLESDVRQATWKLMKSGMLVQNRSVYWDRLDRLKQLNQVFDLVSTKQGQLDNLSDVNKTISKAVQDKYITTDQAALLRSINEFSRYPVTFGLEFKGMKGPAYYSIGDRIIRIDPAKHGQGAYAHEFGHWGFFDVLDSKQRTAAMTEIGKIVEKGELEKHVPLAGTRPHLVENEAEIFAEMFSRYVMNHVLPEEMATGLSKALMKVAGAAKRVIRRMFKKEDISTEMKKYFDVIIKAPDPSLQPGKVSDLNLSLRDFATMDENAVMRALDNYGMLSQQSKTAERELLEGAAEDVSIAGQKMSVVSPDAVAANMRDPFALNVNEMPPMDRVLYADTIMNAVSLGLAKKFGRQTGDLLGVARNALDTIVNPLHDDKLFRDLGSNIEMHHQMKVFGNNVLDNLDRADVLLHGAPLSKGLTESFIDPLDLAYSGTRGPNDPWWMNPATQMRLGPGIAATAIGGLEFGAEDGVDVPGLGKVNWNPVTALTAGGFVTLMTTRPGDMLRRFTKSQTEKLWDKMKLNTPTLYDVATAFHPTQRLPQELHDIRTTHLRMAPSVQRRWNQQIDEIRSKFTTDELSLISDIIEKEGTGWMKAPQSLNTQADNIKDWFADIRQSLIDSGIPEKTFKVGELYAPRVFPTHVKFAGGKIGMTMKNAWDSLWGDYLKKRGMTRAINAGEDAFDQIATNVGLDKLTNGQKVLQFIRLGSDEVHYVHESQKGLIKQFEQMKDYHMNHEWEIDGLKDKRIVLRRDYTKVERELMGEVRDISFRMADFSRKAAHDVALGNTFKMLSENANHVFDPKASGLKGDQLSEAINSRTDRGWIKVISRPVAGTDGVMKYGAMAGKYVSPDAYKLIKDLSSRRYVNDLTNRLHKIVSVPLRAWKIGKTAFNPATHGYNWTANNIMCALDGRNPVSVMRHGFTELIKKGDLYNRAVNAGMLDSNILRGEFDLENMLASLDKAKLKGNGSPDDSVGVMEWIYDHAKKAPKHAIRKVLRTYEIGDEVFKLGVFAQEVAKGKTDVEALQSANRLFFDYRDIPPGIAFIRDWGIMPFASYTYKAIPVMAGTLVKEPHRILGVLAFFSMLNQAMYGADYGADAKNQMEYEKAVQPDYMKNKLYGVGPESSVRVSKRLSSALGGDIPEGAVEYVSTQRAMPLADLFSPQGMFGSYPFGFNPIITLATGLIKGVDPQFMKSIANPEPLTSADKIDNAKKRVQFIIRTVLPNLPFIPGSYSFEKIGNALTAEGLIDPETANQLGWTGKDYFGGKVSLPKELFGMFGVAKFYRMYPNKEYQAQMKKAMGAAYSSQYKYAGTRKDKRSSMEEIKRTRINTRETRKALSKRRGELQKLKQNAPDPRAELIP